MKSVTTVKSVITISIVMLMIASGFILFSYDRSDDGVKILNDDDYEEEEVVRDIVVNPATGEKWDSVKDYRFRNINKSGVEDSYNS